MSRNLTGSMAIGPSFYTKEQETMMASALGRTNGGYADPTPGSSGTTPTALIRKRREARGGTTAQSVGLVAHAHGWVNLGGANGTPVPAGRPYDSGRWGQNGR